MWQPPSRDDVAGGDVAGLMLTADVNVTPARLAVNPTAAGAMVRLFGYAGEPRRPDGAWVLARVAGRVGGGRLQLKSGPDAALRVQPGFSGGPVFDSDTGRLPLDHPI